MSEATLRDLRELSEKATPGEWVRSKHCFQILTADSERSVTELSTPRGRRATNGEVEQWQENVKFIVACVNHVRAALATPSAPQRVAFDASDWLDKARQYLQVIMTHAGLCVDEGVEISGGTIEQQVKLLDALLTNAAAQAAQVAGTVNEARKRQIECQMTLDLMGKEPYLAKGHVEDGEYKWTVVADKISVTELLRQPPSAPAKETERWQCEQCACVNYLSDAKCCNCGVPQPKGGANVSTTKPFVSGREQESGEHRADSNVTSATPVIQPEAQVSIEQQEFLRNEAATDIDQRLNLTREDFNWLQDRLRKLATDLAEAGRKV